MPTDPNTVGPPTAEQQLLDEATAAGSQLRNLAEIPFMLGGLTFIVPPKAMTVKQAIKVDEISIPKKSGKIRQVTGYEAAEITVELEVCDEEGLDGVLVQPAIERLRVLQRLFRDGRASLPKAVEIVSPLTDLMGIRQVYIQELTADEDGTFDWIPVHLVLTEYESIKTQLEHAAAASAASNDAAAEGAEAIEGNEELNRELGYVQDQFNAGMADGAGTETPGEDLDDVGDDE
ncbi:MAG: hypothetical protein Q8O14_14510 [bacterium]|nr:hypothetical protein [bacterium]